MICGHLCTECPNNPPSWLTLITPQSRDPSGVSPPPPSITTHPLSFLKTLVPKKWDKEPYTTYRPLYTLPILKNVVIFSNWIELIFFFDYQQVCLTSSFLKSCWERPSRVNKLINDNEWFDIQRSSLTAFLLFWMYWLCQPASMTPKQQSSDKKSMWLHLVWG